MAWISAILLGINESYTLVEARFSILNICDGELTDSFTFVYLFHIEFLSAITIVLNQLCRWLAASQIVNVKIPLR